MPKVLDLEPFAIQLAQQDAAACIAPTSTAAPKAMSGPKWCAE